MLREASQVQKNDRGHGPRRQVAPRVARSVDGEDGGTSDRCEIRTSRVSRRTVRVSYCGSGRNNWRCSPFARPTMNGGGPLVVERRAWMGPRSSSPGPVSPPKQESPSYVEISEGTVSSLSQNYNDLIARTLREAREARDGLAGDDDDAARRRRVQAREAERIRKKAELLRNACEQPMILNTASNPWALRVGCDIVRHQGLLCIIGRGKTLAHEACRRFEHGHSLARRRRRRRTRRVGLRHKDGQRAEPMWPRWPSRASRRATSYTKRTLPS